MTDETTDSRAEDVLEALQKADALGYADDLLTPGERDLLTGIRLRLRTRLGQKGHTHDTANEEAARFLTRGLELIGAEQESAPTDNPSHLVLETKEQENRTVKLGSLAFPPPIDEDYWSYRVKLSDAQAIVGFKKFGTVGVGFAQEEDRNTNLPYTCPAEQIYDHIAHNKGDESISREDCIAAIQMIQGAAKADREADGAW